MSIGCEICSNLAYEIDLYGFRMLKEQISSHEIMEEKRIEMTFAQFLLLSSRIGNKSNIFPRNQVAAMAKEV